jgi:hypothetical protein
MPWGKMDDKFHRHQKVRALRRDKAGREALGVWVFWWSWCLDDSELTGFVPRDELSASDLKAAEVLVRVELWDKVEGGFQFHNFEKWNPKREQVEAKREADRRRIAGKRGGSRENVARDTARDIDASRARHDGDVARDNDASRENVARESHPRASPSPSPSRSQPTPPPSPVPAQPAPPSVTEVLVDESLRFPEPDAENFNERDLEIAVSDVRGTEWRIPTAPHHRRQARETAALIMVFAYEHDCDPHAVARAAYDGWRKASKSIDPMVWCADWAAKLPPPPKPKEPYRDLEG